MPWWKPRGSRLAVLLDRESRRCFWCGRAVRKMRLRNGPWPKDMATEDHLIPRSKGGSDSLENLVLACYGCNNERGDQPADVFLRRKRGAAG